MAHNFPCTPEGGKLSQLNPTCLYTKCIVGGIYLLHNAHAYRATSPDPDWSALWLITTRKEVKQTDLPRRRLKDCSTALQQ